MPNTVLLGKSYSGKEVNGITVDEIRAERQRRKAQGNYSPHRKKIAVAGNALIYTAGAINFSSRR